MYSEMLRLNGRRALVTGGSRGIGYECARALGDMGARLVVSARGEAEGREAADRFAGEGIEATFIAADLTAPDGPASSSSQAAP